MNRNSDGMQGQGLEKVNEALSRLRSSERGRVAIQHLRCWMASGSLIELDGQNQQAVADILMGLWGSQRGSVADLLNEP